MAVLREIRIRAGEILPTVLGACVAGYFAYHAVQGDRGLLTWLRLKQELGEAETVEARLAGERAAMDRRVRLLRPDNLDPDMLDERAHAVLNYGRRDEYIVLLPQRRRAAE